MSKIERDKPNMKDGKSRIPHFKTIEEAAEWFDTHDTADYEDEFEEVKEPVQFVVRRGKVSKAITVRVDEQTMTALTEQAQEQGVGPSTLVRMWILQHLADQKGHDPHRKIS